MGVSDKELVTIPAGSLGAIPAWDPFLQRRWRSIRDRPRSYDQHNPGPALDATAQDSRCQQCGGRREARTEADLKKAEDEVILGVHQLYYGWLAARKQIEVARAQIAAANRRCREARDAWMRATALEVAAIGAHCRPAQRQAGAVLAAENQASDWNRGSSTTRWACPRYRNWIWPAWTRRRTPDSRGSSTGPALAQSPEVRAAKETATSAPGPCAAARYEYIPDIGAFARHYLSERRSIRGHNRHVRAAETWKSSIGASAGRCRTARRAGYPSRRELRRVTDRVSVDVDKAIPEVRAPEMTISVGAEAWTCQLENQSA